MERDPGIVSPSHRAGLTTKPNKSWLRAPQFWGAHPVDEKIAMFDCLAMIHF